MSRFPDLIPEIDAIEAFGFWLKHSRPGWSISRPAVEQLETGERYAIFVLYREGAWAGVYGSPMGALERIDDKLLTQEYLSLISDADEPPAV